MNEYVLNQIKIERVIAIIRLPNAKHTSPILEAIHQGGLNNIEVTITTPNALGTIGEIAKKDLPHLCLGVGSVVDVQTVIKCADAGAKYIVTPALNEEVIAAAHKRNLPVVAGALTPTEILKAYQLGCSLIKVFPAEFFGMKYIKAIKAPMPYVDLVPTGGVTIANIPKWLDAGATAVAIGSSILQGFDASKSNYDQVTKNATLISEQISRNTA